MNLFPILVGAHVLLAVSLLLPSVLVPFAYAAAAPIPSTAASSA